MQSYIFREFFPLHEDQGREDWWHYVKENQQHILFILDGLDELAGEYRGPIDMLLKGNLLDKVQKSFCTHHQQIEFLFFLISVSFVLL